MASCRTARRTGGPPLISPTSAPTPSSARPTETRAISSAVVPVEPSRYGSTGIIAPRRRSRNWRSRRPMPYRPPRAGPRPRCRRGTGARRSVRHGAPRSPVSASSPRGEEAETGDRGAPCRTDRLAPVPRRHRGRGPARGGRYGMGRLDLQFLLLRLGAMIPVLPYLLGSTGTTALLIALVSVGLALLGVGALVGLISGGPPVRRAVRQLAIGFGAAAVTYGLGAAFGGTVG